jgi:hypothetical protein
MKKETMIAAMRKFVGQRSGITWQDYASGDYKATRAAFMGDYRPILQAGRDAKLLISAIAWRDGVTAEILDACAKSSFSGRLSFVAKGDGVAVDYCAGQYFATEYRKAACAVLASALWAYARDNGYTTREQIQKWARQEFGKGVTARWFN